jgi:hypothetical protein
MSLSPEVGVLGGWALRREYIFGMYWSPASPAFTVVYTRVYNQFRDIFHKEVRGRVPGRSVDSSLGGSTVE